MDSLDRLLEYVEEHIDLHRCSEIDDLYKRSLHYEQVDRPPLYISCEEPFGGFKLYPYRDSFSDPTKMMHNQLIERVLPGLELDCDNSLSIRVDFGVVTLASIIGAKWLMKENYYPWVEPLTSCDIIDSLLEAGRVDLTNELGSEVLRFMEFFNRKLAGYPKCRKGIQIEFPGPQGPFNVLYLLRGTDLYYDCYDNRQIVARLMKRLTEITIDHVRQVKPLTVERQSSDLTCQHGYMIRGNVLLRDDSVVLVSPKMYAYLVRPYDSELLETLGGGSIHFCGNGQHLIDSMLEMRIVKGLDFGNHELMDTSAIYEKCAERGISITGLRPSPKELVSGTAASQYPTGVTFTFEAKTMAEARQVSDCYHNPHHRVMR